ncbi:uncharacterized protein LOC123535622 [Mercenaria mercenaria]|uniref:uncharacterized protein LOC123535622 n=1 Tax=Mercenaria mercenaria TaxID=6596 RepID=UPI00234E7F80|nr:uncharacterized protein LOC123535622 [Mercenaria mercenaria]
MSFIISNVNNMSTCYIFVTLFTVLITNGLCTGSSGSGGPCYSMSQTKCQQAWTNLWVAQHERQDNKICQYFGDLNKCTMDFKATCRFERHEDDLYQEDIVNVYSKKPYSCAVIGGNIRYKEDEGEENSVSRSQQSIYLITFLALILTLT